MDGDVDAGFWQTTAPLEGVDFALPDDADGGEPPALRTLPRPPSWRAASAPASALAGLYASAQRRAAEILRSAVEEAESAAGEGDDAEVDGNGGAT